ncbi:DUF262 domain-containing protein [Citrobacter youngae]|uniref:GmrSD restriction endonuclease domain-containing protein n=1 Tax=Citrobacter youngae TaxID=133448 RepID=UPI000E2E7186|nr:DUF262 domain-containing protein [Citrobacter youngae]MCO4165261.1 DUF262 domain-containing protein [Citrobacter youngae]
MAFSQLTIRQIIQKVSEGEIRIPAFQRDFVWEPDRVQFLMDSIYKGYPIGTVLFWRSREKLSFDRDLGPFTLPEPKKEYPIDYVLDGQQRITSIFSTFQTELLKNKSKNWVPIYFDLDAPENAQDSQFIATDDECIPENYIPLNIIFDVVEYGKYSRKLTNEEHIKKLDELQTKFKEASIPVETVETEEHSKIAIIFERINRNGIPLNTYQLLSAWTWSSEFDLRAKFEELSNKLDDVEYGDLGDEEDLLIKCCAAAMKEDSSSHAIVELKGDEVRNNFLSFQNGLLGAIDFLRRDCGVVSLKVLPYKSMLIPLTRFFMTNNAAGFHPNATQRHLLKKWFWHTCFSRKYSNSVDSAVSQDISAMVELRKDKYEKIERKKFEVTDEFFLDNAFSVTSVNTKTFILLLAKKRPKSFLSGADVDLDDVLTSCNKTEFHHIFPDNYLKTKCGIDERIKRFCLANFAFLSQKDNRSIKDKSPIDYQDQIQKLLKDSIFQHSLIPTNGLEMNYSDFLKARVQLLKETANSLIDGTFTN